MALFYLFSVVDGFAWFWMVSYRNNNMLMLELLKALFLVPHYALMTHLGILPVILLSMLITLYSSCKQVSDLL